MCRCTLQGGWVPTCMQTWLSWSRSSVWVVHIKLRFSVIWHTVPDAACLSSTTSITSDSQKYGTVRCNRLPSCRQRHTAACEVLQHFRHWRLYNPSYLKDCSSSWYGNWKFLSFINNYWVRGTEENHKKKSVRVVVPGLRFESGTSGIKKKVCFQIWVQCSVWKCSIVIKCELLFKR